LKRLKEEVTIATRSATINGVQVAEGEVISLHNGELKVTGTTVEEVVRALLEEMDTAEWEIITLYYGKDVSESDANGLAEVLQEDWPDQEIEIIGGGQPLYH
jgi:hypothetical protein